MSYDPERASRLGFVCPNPACKGRRLLIDDTKRVARGIVVRYRQCPTCSHRERTEERRVRVSSGLAK